MQRPNQSHTNARPIRGAQLQAQSVRAAAAADLLAIGEATFWRWNKSRPDFPQPRRIGPKTTVWDAAELIAWRDAQG
jgi:prophage regulatory protein